MNFFLYSLLIQTRAIGQTEWYEIQLIENFQKLRTLAQVYFDSAKEHVYSVTSEPFCSSNFSNFNCVLIYVFDSSNKQPTSNQKDIIFVRFNSQMLSTADKSLNDVSVCDKQLMVLLRYFFFIQICKNSAFTLSRVHNQYNKL